MKKLILLLLLLKGALIMAQIPSFSITSDTNNHFLLIEQSSSGSLFALMTG